MLVIELCVCEYYIWKAAVGKELLPECEPVGTGRAVMLYFTVSRGHDDGELSLLIVVGG